MFSRRGIVFAAIGAVIVALAALAWHLWPALQPPRHIEVGTPVGGQVPVEMPLRNAAGEPATLAEIAGPNGTVLLLVRSADWCPFCILQLEQAAQIGAELERRGLTLASLSYDPPEDLAEFAGSIERPFVMLSDSDSRFIDAVGLRDPQYEPGHYAHGVPRASVLVLAPDGTIKAKLVSADYRQRPDNGFVLAMAEKALAD